MLSLSESGSSDHDDDEDEDDGDYLHPSLFASKKCDRLEELMKVRAALLKPSCPCLLSQSTSWWFRPRFFNIFDALSPRSQEVSSVPVCSLTAQAP